MRRVIVNVTYALLTGYILCYYSEWMFWGGSVRPAEFGEYLAAWLFYSFATYLFLVTVYYFRVRSVWAMFLAGAVYGWLVEGVLVQTMYDDFPLNISTTGLSWHALISVLFGWYFLRRALRTSTTAALRVILALALYYGLWAHGWWSEGAVHDPTTLFVYFMQLGLPLLFAYLGLERLGDDAFRPTRWGVILALLLLAAYYVFVTVPTQPLALLILPPAMAFVLFFLRRNRQHEAETVTQITARAPTKRVLLVLLIPLLASLIYALLYSLDWRTLWAGYLLTMPAGFILLFVSAYRVWRTGSQVKSP